MRSHYTACESVILALRTCLETRTKLLMFTKSPVELI